MIVNQNNFNGDLREIFCNSVVKVFQNSTKFFDFLDFEKYCSKFDCFLDPSGENYIINTITGEYINWYKEYNLGRCINISVLEPDKDIIKWLEEFLVKFKESGDVRFILK